MVNVANRRVPPITDVYLSSEHKRVVVGATRSKHLDGTAFDIATTNHDPATFEAVAHKVGFFGFDCYPRSAFIHDDRGPAQQ